MYPNPNLSDRANEIIAAEMTRQAEEQSRIWKKMRHGGFRIAAGFAGLCVLALVLWSFRGADFSTVATVIFTCWGLLCLALLLLGGMDLLTQSALLVIIRVLQQRRAPGVNRSSR